MAKAKKKASVATKSAATKSAPKKAAPPKSATKKAAEKKSAARKTTDKGFRKTADPAYHDAIEESPMNQGVNVEGENLTPTVGETTHRTVTRAVSQDSLRSGFYGGEIQDGSGGHSNQAIPPDERDPEYNNTL